MSEQTLRMVQAFIDALPLLPDESLSRVALYCQAELEHRLRGGEPTPGQLELELKPLEADDEPPF